jgi:hypothetical protein
LLFNGFALGHRVPISIGSNSVPSAILVVVKLGEIDSIYFVCLLGFGVPAPLVTQVPQAPTDVRLAAKGIVSRHI